MRLHTKSGVVIMLPAFPFTEAIVEMLTLVQRDLPRADFMSDTGAIIPIRDLCLDVEDILSLNTHHW